MTEEAGVEYAESRDITVRVAARDGEFFALTEDYRFDRVNIELQLGVIVVADAW
jgi:anti-sigma regulatory factor (Ser/Thr protein kinase)